MQDFILELLENDDDSGVFHPTACASTAATWKHQQREKHDDAWKIPGIPVRCHVSRR